MKSITLLFKMITFVFIFTFFNIFNVAGELSFNNSSHFCIDTLKPASIKQDITNKKQIDTSKFNQKHKNNNPEFKHIDTHSIDSVFSEVFDKLRLDPFDEKSSFFSLNSNLEKKFSELLYSFDPFKKKDIDFGIADTKELSLKQLIVYRLMKDGYISTPKEVFEFELNEEYLLINGKKQNKMVYYRYKNLIENNCENKFGKNYIYKYSNKVSKKELKKI